MNHKITKAKPTKRNVKAERILDALANFIASNAALKSIMLEMEAKRDCLVFQPKLAHEWANLCQAVGTFGYPQVHEVRQTLREIFGQ